MAVKQPPFTVGIEEEYLLVELESRDLDNDPPAGMLEECTELGGGQVTPEFLRSQIEIGTRVCRSMEEARAELARLRGIVVRVARRHGLAPIAASTHPFARAIRQKHTEKDRYFALAREMQAAARRMVICGMHVHVGLEDDELRIDLMNQLSYFLPHLLALSCSSPFWEGENSGLKSFRLTVFNALPRTGLPERFASYGEYQRHIDTLIQNNLIQDTSKIWWDEGMLDLAKGVLVPFAELLEELLELICEDAEALGCTREVLHAREILRRGTSAHRQVKVYDDARGRGASEREALNAVVDWLVGETARGAQT